MTDTSPEAVEAMIERLAIYSGENPLSSWRSQCEREIAAMLRAVDAQRSNWSSFALGVSKQLLAAEAEAKALRERNEALVAAISKIAPIVTNDGPDYAEVTFSDGVKHSSQAMTMNPQDWLDIQAAYEAALAANKEK